MKKEKNRKANTYAHISIREQLFLEARAMAEHALANGKTVPATAIRIIDSFTTEPCVAGNEENLRDLIRVDEDMAGLVEAHNALVNIVAPAKPRSLLILDMEQKNDSIWNILGAVSLVRQLILVAIICLVLFVGIGLSADVNKEAASILDGSGMPLFLNLLFYLSAAGLGASFAGLYKANAYITEGTFDATYHASYWIRFLLGLIAGLIIAVMISEKAFTMAGEYSGLLEQGVVRPLLAMLGGFSADMVYTLLSRLVETVESLFRGSSKQMISMKIQEANARFENNRAYQDLNIVLKIMKTNWAITDDTDPTEVKKKLESLVKEIIPDAVINVK